MLLSPFKKLPVYRVPDQNIQIEIGNIQAKIWVVLFKHEFEPNHLSFLEKIFSSINKKINQDIAIFSIPKGNSQTLPLTDPSEKTIFCFGQESNHLGLNTSSKKYKWYPLLGFTLVFCDELTQLQSSPESKKQLWNMLKPFADNA
jgi:hypothetical protein